MRYEGNIYRPPSEADSYLLQVTIGCSHNQCTFCAMYKDKTYHIRSFEEIKTDIDMAKAYFGSVRDVFLCDGDAIAVKTDLLLAIVAELKKAFPYLKSIACYAGPKSTLGKSMSELKALREAGIDKVYLGVETGDDRLLKEINKGATAGEMRQAGQNLVAAGFKLSVTVLLGLAGKGPRSHEHAVHTAEIINAIHPKWLAALTVSLVPGTPLYQKAQEGSFQLLDPFETLEEMKEILEHITIDGLIFRSNHVSNYLPVKGELQKDRQKMIDLINGVLETRDEKYLRSESMRGF